MPSDRALLLYSVVMSTITAIALVGIVVWSYIELGGNSTKQYVLRQNISLMDWGIAQLDKRLDRQKSPQLTRHKKSAYYDFETNTISLSASTAWEMAESLAEAESWCRALIGEMRAMLSVDADSGRPEIGGNSAAHLHFEHAGYRSVLEPDTFKDDLDRMFELQGYVHVEDKGVAVRCVGPLIGQEVKVTHEAPNWMQQPTPKPGAAELERYALLS